MKRELNVQALIELLISFSFGAAMLYLAVSNQFLAFVAPRMKPYFIFMAIISSAWCILAATKLFKSQHRQRITPCFVLTVPLMLLFLSQGNAPISVSAVNGNYAGGKTIGTTMASAETIQSKTSSAVYQPSVSSAPKKGMQAGEGCYKTKNMYDQPVTIHGFDSKDKKIVISDKEFYTWVNAIYNDMNKLNGYQVTMTGSVYKNSETLETNQFVPARLLMTCCTADLEPCGLLCEYSNISSLKKDEWVTVTGTITKGTYHGNPEPHIVVQNIKPAAPLNGYIYPS